MTFRQRFIVRKDLMKINLLAIGNCDYKTETYLGSRATQVVRRQTR